MRFLVTMGTYHPSDRRYQRKWHYFGALMQVVDWETGRVEREVSWEPRPGHLGGEGRLLFMGADLAGPDLFVTTKTEVLRYDRDTLEPRHVFSHPDFCDLHSVIRAGDRLWVANTGKEAVQAFDLEGRLQEEIVLSETPLADRWDPDRDYRQQRDAKPYEAHLNQVFRRGDEVWVTSLLGACALDVRAPARRMEIAVGQPHDGRLAEGRHWFTTTNGHLVSVDPETLATDEVLDLNELWGGDALIGWCRGVEVVGRRAFCAFTRIRETKHGLTRFWSRPEAPKAPSRIVEVDLDRRTVVRELPISHEGAAVYSILLYDR